MTDGKTTRRQVLLGLAGTAALAGCGAHTSRSASSSPPAPSPTSAPPTPLRSTATSRAAPDYAALASQLSGTLRRPADSGYDTVRLLFDRRFDDVRPAAVASVTSVADVQACVAFARAHGLPLAVRSGGHSYAGGSVGTGLVIDLRGLSSVTVGSGTATIGAGAALVDVYSALAAHDVSIPAGSCPTVGIGGLTLGGGIGVVDRSYGVTSDRLVSADVVLADGRTVTASASSEPDLYWALRGGGGSFGVVTALTLTTHPIQDLATFTYTWPWSSAAAVLGGWQASLPGAPNALWSTCFLLASTGSGPNVSVSGVYVGSTEACTAALAPMLRAISDAPSSGSVRTRSYLETMLLEAGCADLSQTACHVADETAGGTLPRDAFVGASDLFAAPIPAAGIASLIAAVAARQAADLGNGGAQFDSWGGAMNDLAADATAFVHRGIRFSAQYTASWGQTPGNGPLGANQRSLAAIKGSVSRYATGAAYQNYADPTLSSAGEAYYGANLARLQTVKKTYDSDNLFRPPQGITPA